VLAVVKMLFFSEGAGGVSHRVEITLYLCLWCIENGKSAKMMHPDGNLRTLAMPFICHIHRNGANFFYYNFFYPCDSVKIH